MRDETVLSYKKRIQRTINQEPIDHLPTQINYTHSMQENLKHHFGLSEEELPDHFDNHLLRIDIDYKQNFSQDRKIVFDWWGVGFDAQEEGYFTVYNPLHENKDLDVYPWPDPNDPLLMEKAQDTIKNDDGEYFLIPNLGFALFERAWALRGFDTFLMDMVLDPDYAAELLDRITSINITLIQRFIELGVDGGYFGDDYGSQQNMLFSPKLWRQLIKPRLARLFNPFREAGLPILMHSDGQISKILPDLIEIGLTTYNPVQPEVIDHGWLRKTFGDQLTFYGGISTQNVLSQGSPNEVKKAIEDCVSILAPENTGLIIAPSHRVMTDTPLENINAMLEAFKDFRE